MPPCVVCGILLRRLGLGLEVGHAPYAGTSFARVETAGVGWHLPSIKASRGLRRAGVGWHLPSIKACADGGRRVGAALHLPSIKANYQISMERRTLSWRRVR